MESLFQVISDSSGKGWLSIDFSVPYGYKDEIIKCAVLDQGSNSHEDKKTFPIGGKFRRYLGDLPTSLKAYVTINHIFNIESMLVDTETISVYGFIDASYMLPPGVEVDD